MLWRRQIANADLATPERRAGAERRLMALINEIGDPKVREHYRLMMQERLRALFAPKVAVQNPSAFRSGDRWAQGRAYARPPFGPERPGARAAWTPPVSEAVRRSAAARAATLGPNPSQLREEALMLAVLSHSFLLEEQAETVATLPISEPNLDKLRRELLHAASSGQSLDSKGLRDHLTLRGLKDICERLERRAMLKTMAMTRADTAQAVVVREWDHVVARHLKLTALEAEHQQAAEALKREATEENVARLRAIAQELTSLAGAEAGPPDAF
jgi:DNA primase